VQTEPWSRNCAFAQFSAEFLNLLLLVSLGLGEAEGVWRALGLNPLRVGFEKETGVVAEDDELIVRSALAVPGDSRNDPVVPAIWVEIVTCLED